MSNPNEIHIGDTLSLDGVDHIVLETGHEMDTDMPMALVEPAAGDEAPHWIYTDGD